jgi:hypothetical protein
MANERRPAAVVGRDDGVARYLANGQVTMAKMVEDLGHEPNLVYNSVSRLRRAGFVEKVRVGGRTPVWGLTPAGVTYVQGLDVTVPA